MIRHLIALAFVFFGFMLPPASASNNTIVLALANEPPQLNSTKSGDVVSSMVLGHTFEGLTRVGKDLKPIPGIAERWDVTGTGVTFYLRKDARWSNGKPVTAHDFVYAWQQVVDPKNASSRAFIMHAIKNAQMISAKKMTDLNQLGVKALDDYTLKVELAKPCSYFVSLTSARPFLPVNKEFHQLKGDKYGANAEDLIYNGPFVLAEWVHGASLRLKKNQYYHAAPEITIDEIYIPYITADNLTAFNLFKDKKIDFVQLLQKETIQSAQQDGFKINHTSDDLAFYLKMNHAEGHLTANENLRKAIALVIDPAEFVTKIVGIPGTKPAYGLIPSYMPGAAGKFRKEFPLQERRVNVAQAKKYLAQAMAELNLKTPPSLTLLIDDLPHYARVAEYFQRQLMDTLGISLRVDKQIFKQRLAKQNAGEFDIVYWGWSPDFPDPMSFADLLASWNVTNVGKFSNSTFDQLIAKAQGTSNAKVRMESMAAAERIALETATMIPLLERSIVYLSNDRLANIVITPTDFKPNFARSTLQ